METNLRAKYRHLPNGITHCHLLLDISERARPLINSSKANRNRFIYPEEMVGEVDCILVIYRDGLPVRRQLSI